jgi:cytochrome c-type biogenesis protein
MLDVSLATGFLAGIVSFLSPCILPLVPPYLCFLTGSSLEDLGRSPKMRTSARAVWRALGFVAGFAAVFVALGATASSLGQQVSDHLGILSRVAGALIVLLGLHMLGLLRLPLLLRQARLDAARPADFLGAVLVGLAFGFGWTPCVGPVLTAILLMAGAEDSAGRGAALLAAYAAGIGVPFVAAAAFTGPVLRLLARFRRHLSRIEMVMGSILVVTGLLIFLGLMPLVGNWLQEAVPLLGRIG